MIIAGLTHSYGNWGQFYLIKTDANGDIKLFLQEGDSLWVQTQYMTPADFNGMTLFWGLRECCYDTDLEYNVYRPEGYLGGVIEDPFSCDLSPFMGNKLIFEFKNNAGVAWLKSDAYVWDYGVPGGMVGFSGYPFFFAFYQLDDSGWPNREIVEYMPGEVSDTEPPHGDLFYSHPSIGCGGNIRSDFQESISISVNIDIKPGSYPNGINLGDQGLLPIAVLGSTQFDVNMIDPGTIEIGSVTLAQRGSSKSPKLSFSFEDVNSDGITDMMTFFEVQRLVNDGVLNEVTTELRVTATLNDGKTIEGSDSVNIVH